MRIIAVGCQYTGVSTLFQGLMAWGQEQGIRFHLDDHFTIPDTQHLSAEDKKLMVNLSPILKERHQRMQIVYHVRLMHRYDHILLGGFHIEEDVYGPLYYYPGIKTISTRQYEVEMPDDTILVHLTARPEVIQARLEIAPHEYSLIKTGDISMLLDRFREEVRASWLKQKIEIDTSDLRPEQLLERFFQKAFPFLSLRDMMIVNR